MSPRASAWLRHEAKSRLGPIVAGRRARRTDLPLATWGLSIGTNGTLWSGPIDLTELAREHGTPLHVARADLLDRNALDALAPRRESEPAGAEIFYSYTPCATRSAVVSSSSTPTRPRRPPSSAASPPRSGVA